jgi:TldD protein
MSRMNRRQFIVRGGASMAGVMLSGSLVDRLFAAPGAATGNAMIDVYASIVADLERKFPYASALFAANGGITMRRDRNGKGVSESGFAFRGSSLRVFDGAVFHEAAVSSEDPDALRAAAQRLIRDVPLAKERFRIEPMSPKEGHWTTEMTTDPLSISLEERMARLESEYERSNWDDPRIRSVAVTTSTDRFERIFVDRTRRLSSTTSMVSHVLVLFGFDQGKPGFGVARQIGQAGLELATFSEAALEQTRRETVQMFGATPVPAGEYDVVFSPEVSGLLAHESFGHGVEMDQFVKERAKAQEFLGKSVASPIVTMYDDPALAGARGSYPFDDEGMLAGSTQIIEGGVFRRPLTDLMSAVHLGTARTANGRTQAWDRKVYPRMSNTFFGRGETAPEELFASLSDGLYLEGFQNGIEDPQGWGIQFTAARAHEYKNGKPTGKVFAPATVTGYVPEILSRITMIANDFALEPATCGKGFKEFVPVSAGGPHLRTRARVS